MHINGKNINVLGRKVSGIDYNGFIQKDIIVCMKAHRTDEDVSLGKKGLKILSDKQAEAYSAFWGNGIRHKSTVFGICGGDDDYIL